jgi:hypothetical protein
MEIYDVVKKLTGEVNPVGETNTDNDRFENLKTLCDLVDKLLTDIDGVIPNKRRHEFSMKRAGDYAGDFYTRIGIEE